MPTSANKFIGWLIAAVWLINGLFCKVLHMVPRHEAIVARILGAEWSVVITILIGFAEIFMGIWILSGYARRSNAFVQIVTIAVMNVLELVFASDLLLWGPWNMIFAFLFISLIYANQVYFHQKSHHHHARLS